MSLSLEDIKILFNKYISIYIGSDTQNQNYNDDYLRNKIIKIAYDNKAHYIELSKIIINLLNKVNTDCKIRLFDIIDFLFKSEAGDYVSQLTNYLYDNFKECFLASENLDERILLFRMFYTWKYIVPKNITDKIRKDLNMDDIREICQKNYPDKLKKCEEFNESLKKKLIKKNNAINANNNSNINIKKEFKEDKNTKDNKIQIDKKIKILEEKEKEIKNNNKNIMIGKKRGSSHDKSSDANSITKKKTKIKVDNKKIIPSNFNIPNIPVPNQNNNINNPIILPSNINNNININNNNMNNNINMNNGINMNNISMNNNINIPQIPQLPIIPQTQNNINNINNPNNIFINNNPNTIPNVINQNNAQQNVAQAIMNIIRNFSNTKLQQGISTIEFVIFHFISESNIKIDQNLRFFSSLAKFFNESVKNKDTVFVKCEYEDIYKNPEYQQILQNVNNSLFNNIKKNICAICGFRTLYYNKLTEHLDIHFNINYLEKEGKNLFRKKGNNRNNWINGDNNINKNTKNYLNEIRYTLNNLLYYKNMINNQLVTINNLQQEEENEDFMYPIDDNNIRNCELCGDEFKKIFSTKYSYWFYTEIVKVKDEKTKLIVHKTCYDEMVKKI